VAHVIRDLRAIPSGWNWLQRKVFGFWDNNIGIDRKYLAELCEALVPLKRFWATETSVDTITPESARLLGRAGCRFVYIGLESLAEESLKTSNKRQNRVSEYRERIRHLHDNGMIVMSIFLLGLDGDTEEYLSRLPNLIEEVGVDVPVFSLAAPILHTPFRRALESESRLLPGDLLDGMDGVHLVYRPLRVPADELELALGLCMKRAYTPGRVLRRMLRRIPDGLWASAASAFCNSFYVPYQRTIADAVRDRVERRGPWPGHGVAETELASARLSTALSEQS
jgi:radical SAM superfamily enzyme YgiQ (UPF0313 family)